MRPEEERFWPKVDKTDDCWLWTAAIQNGYGVFMLSSRKQIKAHRWSYQQMVGPIPDGLTLDHLCRVRHCVNPAHLEPVTMGENNRRSTGFRPHKTECPQGHSYAEHGRDQNGYPVCRICDTDRHRARRSTSWA